MTPHPSSSIARRWPYWLFYGTCANAVPNEQGYFAGAVFSTTLGIFGCLPHFSFSPFTAHVIPSTGVDAHTKWAAITAVRCLRHYQTLSDPIKLSLFYVLIATTNLVSAAIVLYYHLSTMREAASNLTEKRMKWCYDEVAWFGDPCSISWEEEQKRQEEKQKLALKQLMITAS